MQAGGLRPIDVVLAWVAVLMSVAVGGAMLTAIGSDAQQAHCAANLTRLGQASAVYEAAYDSFAPCDPYLMMPQCIDDDCRGYDAAVMGDPSHSWLAFHGLGLRPQIPDDHPRAAWADVPWGFTVQAQVVPETLWPGLLCPAQVWANTSALTSTEIDFGVSWTQAAGAYHSQASGYMVNRLLRSATDGYGGPGSQGPRLPSSTLANNLNTWDNVYSTPAVALTGLTTVEPQYIQAVHSDELVSPVVTVYMADTLDYRIGDSTSGDVLVDARYGAARVSAGTYVALHMDRPAGVVLGARHGGRANVLYADGHVSDDNQMPRNQRGELITASTFADFVTEHDLGTQHHLMPGGRWFDAAGEYLGGFAPGDDQAPTVVTTAPTDGGQIATAKATSVTVQFSEQILVDASNITVNAGAVVPTRIEYDPRPTAVRLTFDPPLAVDTYNVQVSPAITDVMGNQLDGNADGSPGDAYAFTFTVTAEHPAGATIVVGPDHGVQAAVNAAQHGDIIVLEPGVYCEWVDLAGKAVTIRSTDPADRAVVAQTVIHGLVEIVQNEARDTVLEGLTLEADPVCGLDGPPLVIDGASPTVRGCRIVDQAGGGIVCTDASPLIEACVLSGNGGDFGVATALYRCAAVIRNSAFIANHATGEGAAIFTVASDDVIVNNTFVDNTADGAGFGGATVLCVSGDALVANNIFHGNASGDLAAFDANLTVEHNLFDVVPAAYIGLGNIAGDPLLAVGADGVAHIASASPCIDVGSATAATLAGPTDIDGQARVALGGIDIGADEFAVPALRASDPAGDQTLSKIGNNVIRLTFDGPVTLPAEPALSIAPLAGGDGVGTQFACTVEPDGVTLAAVEEGAALTNQTWYRITPMAALEVEPFALDVCTLIGDANGDGRVMAVDLGVIWSHNGEVTNARYDINGDGRVMAVDLGVAWSHNGQVVPPKP